MRAFVMCSQLMSVCGYRVYLCTVLTTDWYSTEPSWRLSRRACAVLYDISHPAIVNIHIAVAVNPLRPVSWLYSFRHNCRLSMLL